MMNLGGNILLTPAASSLVSNYPFLSLSFDTDGRVLGGSFQNPTPVSIGGGRYTYDYLYIKSDAITGDKFVTGGRLSPSTNITIDGISYLFTDLFFGEDGSAIIGGDLKVPADLAAGNAEFNASKVPIGGVDYLFSRVYFADGKLSRATLLLNKDDPPVPVTPFTFTGADTSTRI